MKMIRSTETQIIKILHSYESGRETKGFICYSSLKRNVQHIL